mmetsp:Transcript_29953/g.80077  ORF Transcript_29953/g.80077 Transcript_29953/m.80077 type:complete len:86 (+) Transcript_29953:108-365(+)
MGLTSSQLQDPFRDFSKWDIEKANKLLTTFKTSGVDFGAGWEDVAILLDGETTAAKEVVQAFSVNGGTIHLPSFRFRRQPANHPG